MGRIQTIFLISHTHTDIGYTDYQDAVFRQHLAFIDRAIELGEETADYPPEARFRWTCELAAIVLRYFRERPSTQIDRFLELHRRGQMAVAAMAYHWTPLLSPSGMVRSLRPLQILRQEYGLTIENAMQCDVNGASWLWADLLPAVGVNGLTMSINMHRGYKPPMDAFWWQGPGGGRLLAFNGPHYADGIFKYGLSDWERAQSALPAVIEKFENRPDYPFDFLYAQATHPTRADNGPPTAVLSEFVRRWNQEGDQPRMEFVTLDQFMALVQERYGDSLPTFTGDWVDWWADGVASSAYETAVYRETAVLLPLLDFTASLVEGVDPAAIQKAYESAALYAEHTWGTFDSIRRPQATFTRAVWNCKAGYVYEAYALAHELLTYNGRSLTQRLTNAEPEGEFQRPWTLTTTWDPMANPDDQRFLLLNPTAAERHIVWPLPPDLGGTTPHAMLEMFLTGNFREDAPLQADPPSQMVITATVPAFGYTVVTAAESEISPEERVGDGVIENKWYRAVVDTKTGGLQSWYDKELGRELASQHGLWKLGQYIYEWVDSPKDRLSIYRLDYFNRDDFGERFTDTPFRRQGPVEVEVLPAQIDPFGVSITLHLKGRGATSIKSRIRLPRHEKALYLDLVIEKTYYPKAEAIYIPFAFTLDDPQFHLDLNGIALEPEQEQLPGSCRDWYSLQRWAAVGDESTTITLVPVDAPLVQVGGITTGRWADRLEPAEPTIVSWPVQNHWDTNFKGGQGDELLFRYRLTSQSAYDPVAASRFAAEILSPPLIVRVPDAAEVGGRLFTIEPEGVVDVQVQGSLEGDGYMVTFSNQAPVSQRVKFGFAGTPIAAAYRCSPLEEVLEPLLLDEDQLTILAAPRTLTFVRLFL